MYEMPPAMRQGDVIGIAAPASPAQREALDRGVQILLDWGFAIRSSETPLACEGYLAGSDDDRARELMELFLDPSVKAILCARGGYGSPRLLPLLDYEKIRQYPKPIVGFSDITALLCALSERCGWVTFHGPMVTTLADSDAESRQALYASLLSGVPPVIRPRDGTTLRTGVATGPLVGGNLSTLCHLLGTPYEPAWKGRILFIEDRGEPLYRIDRMLTHLKLAGCLDRLAGLVVGDFEGVERPADVWQVVMSLVKGAGYPVAGGFPVGHGPSNHTLALGMPAVLDAGAPSLGFLPE
jgi:muramoyltetrapeptide carboxypeptidase